MDINNKNLKELWGTVGREWPGKRHPKGLAKMLLEISSDKLGKEVPEIRLVLAIIVDAAIKRDEEYVASKDFDHACKTIYLSPWHIRRLIVRTWEYCDAD